MVSAWTETCVLPKKMQMARLTAGSTDHVRWTGLAYQLPANLRQGAAQWMSLQVFLHKKQDL